MFKIISERLRQKHRTLAYPDGEAPAMPDRFRGLPVLDDSKCPGRLPGVRRRLSDRRHLARRARIAVGHGPLPVLHRMHRRIARRGRFDSPANTAWLRGGAKT